MREAMMFLLSSIYRKRYDMSRYSASRGSLPPLPAPAFVYIEQGRGLLHLDDAAHIMEPHQVCFIMPGMQVRIEPFGGPIHYYLLFVRCVTADGPVQAARPDDFPPLLPGILPLQRDEASYDQVRELYDVSRSPSASRFEVNVYFQEWLSDVLRRIRTEQNRVLLRSQDGIQRSIEYIHRNFHHKLALDNLAAIAGFTPTSYSREFKKMTGMSPVDYLTAYRIDHAKRLLVSSRHPIKKVSADCGFGSEFYFSRVFKREVGVSPTLYRGRKDIRVAAVSCLRFHDTLESLGVHPVYSVNCYPVRTVSREEHDAEVALHFERLQYIRPELIISDSYHLPYMEQLERIAPTCIVDYSADWRAICRQIAALVGREQEAEHDIASADDQLYAAKDILSRRFGDATVTLMRVVHKLIRIQGTSQHPLNVLIYDELGFKPGRCVPAHQMHVEYSPNQYPDFDTDHLLIQNYFYFPGDEDVLRNIQKTGTWQAIRAVSRGEVHYIDNWFGMSWSSPGRMRIISDLLAL